ncbi:hypothetical protein FRB99_002276 [Tulasnella sp. 403]|nr:hypothetical protein FRB99_002276 [Tulasnella sp. 403]
MYSPAIHRLPIEILQRIITDTLDPGDRSYYQSVFELLRVCAYWRQAIESYTLIWSYIDVSFGEIWNGVALKKSGSAQLSIKCDKYTVSQHAYLHRFFDMVVRNIHRCRRLVLNLTEDDFRWYNTSGTINAILRRCALASMAFHVAITDRHHPASLDEYSTSRSVFLALFSLLTLDVGTFENLTTLQINFLGFSHLSPQELHEIRDRTQHLVFTSPVLRRLILHGPRAASRVLLHFDYSSLPSAMTLPELAYISFRDIPPQLGACLLTNIHPENLKWLEISNRSDYLLSAQYLLANSHPQFVKSLHHITRSTLEEAVIQTKPTFNVILRGRSDVGLHLEAPGLAHSHEPVQQVLSLIPKAALDPIRCITISFPEAGFQEICDLLRSHFPSICYAILEVSNTADWRRGIGFLSTPGLWPRLRGLTVYAAKHTKITAHDLFKFLRTRVGCGIDKFERLEVFDPDLIQLTGVQREELLTLVDVLVL